MPSFLHKTLSLLLVLTVAAAQECKPLTTQAGVDLSAFVSRRWFIHQQMATQAGNPDNRYNSCVYADYTLKDATTVGVKNHAEEGGVSVRSPFCVHWCHFSHGWRERDSLIHAFPVLKVATRL